MNSEQAVSFLSKSYNDVVCQHLNDLTKYKSRLNGFKKIYHILYSGLKEEVDFLSSIHSKMELKITEAFDRLRNIKENNDKISIDTTLAKLVDFNNEYLSILKNMSVDYKESHNIVAMETKHAWEGMRK